MTFLKIIIGPMYAGKTNEIIKIYNSLKNTNNILVIDYTEDFIVEKDILKSHDDIQIPCYKCNDLNSIKIYLKESFCEYDYIIINEAQFFENLKNWVLNELENENKNLILCGLDSDFKRNKFGEIWDLIPHADKIEKLTGKCNYCTNNSLYSYRITNQLDKQIIMDCTLYLPLCRNCYLKYSIN